MCIKNRFSIARRKERPNFHTSFISSCPLSIHIFPDIYTKTIQRSILSVIALFEMMMVCGEDSFLSISIVESQSQDVATSIVLIALLLHASQVSSPIFIFIWFSSIFIELFYEYIYFVRKNYFKWTFNWIFVEWLLLNVECNTL